MIGKRVLLILLPVVIAFSVVYGTYQFIKPRVQHWLLEQVGRLSEQKLPVRVKIQEIDWSLLFPSLQIRGIEVQPKDESLPPVKIKEVSASLDLLALISGRLAISTLLADQPQMQLNLDSLMSRPNSQEKPEPLPLKDFFDFLKKVPVSRIAIQNGEFLMESEKLKTGLLLGTAHLFLSKSKDGLHLQWNFENSVVDYDELGEIPFHLDGEAHMNETALDLSTVKVGVLNTLLNAKGSFTDLPRLFIQPIGTLEFEILSDLDRVSQVGKNLIHLPPMQGRIDSSGRFEFKGAEKLDAGFKLSGNKLKIGAYHIGDIQFSGRLLNQMLQIPRISLAHPSGNLSVEDLKLDFSRSEEKKNTTLSARFASDKIDLHELLKKIDVGDLPLKLHLGTQLNCAGPIYPMTEFRCQGQAKGSQLEVRTGPRIEDTLVAIDAFSADGEFTVTDKQVQYKTQLTVAEDRGASDGVIAYKDGFKINYSSPLFQFKNLKRLAGLKLEGASEVQGSTQGDSDAATFNMNLKTQNFVFEDFALGSPSGALSYEKGVLKFDQIEAVLNNTHYETNVQVDLNKKEISADGSLSRFDLVDVLSVFGRIFKMPVELNGTGAAKFRLQGPFDLAKLSYDLNASVHQGSIAGETFDLFSLQMNSVAGDMKLQNAKLLKNKNVITASGQSNPAGQIDIVIEGSRLPLEESENVSKLGSQISGLLDVRTTLKGPIREPDINVVGRIYQLNMEELDFAESTFDIDFHKNSLRGNTNLFSGQLVSKFRFPLNDSSPFELDLQAKNWNYTTLLALVGGGSLLSEYKANLNGDLQLASDSGGLWAASGRGTINTLLLQRGSLTLVNPSPMELSMNSGIATLSNFRLEGEQTFFDIKGKSISKDDLNLRLEGKANLRLFQIFVPFLEELNGSANIAADVSGPLLKPEVFGNADIRGGFVKLKGFPHAFENLTADVQFSQSKVLINGFNGVLAGGRFEGDGSILISGPQNIPTNIKATLSGVSLNVPDRVRTNGDAEVIFSGNWFPFTLSGTYHVQGGFMDKEFTEESASNNLKQSSYLPKMILQSAFEPVLLDLNIVLEKPLAIKNSMVDGSVSGQITVKGPPAQPILGGQVLTEKGTKAIFRDKVFEVQSANVRFTNEADVNPDLYVTARSRIDEYDINMLIQGKAKNPALKLSSVPPLSDQDIISLIALGVRTESLEKQVQSGNKAKEETLKGAALGVFSQQGIFKKLQDTAGVQLQISTSYDDTRNVSVQRVTLSKKLSDKVRASATQTSASSTSSNEYSLQYNFTDNWSAIGRYEDRRSNENTNSSDSNRESQSILGLDLEFKKEFK